MAKSKNFVMLRKKNPRNIEETLSEKALSERRAKALDLRMAGASYQNIVDAKIGYSSPSHVSHDMRKIVDEFRYEQPEDVLILDLARLDELQKYLTFAFRSGDFSQANTIMRVMQFRRETLGITPELIQQRRAEKTQIQNNGIMVIQGNSTTSDYLASLMAASGASETEVQQQRARLQLESPTVAQNRSVSDPGGKSALTEVTTSEVIDAEVLSDSDDDTNNSDVDNEVINSPIQDLTSRMQESAQRNERLAEARENLDIVPGDSPLLTVDIPDNKSPQVKKLRIKIKQPDTNQAPVAGVVYRAAPRKIKLRKQEKPQYEEITTSTETEQI